MPESAVNILLVDDHPLVRESLVNLIHQQADLRVSAEAGSAEEALQLIKKKAPDLAIIDISLSGSSGLELVKRMKADYPRIPTVVLSMHDERLYAERAIRAGARGYIMKSESTKRIIHAIRQVLAGNLAISESVANSLAEKFVSGETSFRAPAETLSDRELEIFRLMGQGRDTRSISDALHISIKTVQAYCARIKEKLNLENATELLREAILWIEDQNRSS